MVSNMNGVSVPCTTVPLTRKTVDRVAVPGLIEVFIFDSGLSCPRMCSEGPRRTMPINISYASGRSANAVLRWSVSAKLLIGPPAAVITVRQQSLTLLLMVGLIKF